MSGKCQEAKFFSERKLFIRFIILNILASMSTTTLSRNYEFYANADLSEYAGEWIAILNERVIAHGNNVKELIKKTKERDPDAAPFIAKIPQG